MSPYSIHHAALRIDYLVQAYAQVVPGAPYDPRGVPAEILCDMWHHAAAQGHDPNAIQIQAGSWQRCVADLLAVEDRVRSADARLADRLAQGVTGLEWEQVSGVIEDAGPRGWSHPVAPPGIATLPRQRARRFGRVLAGWSDDAGYDPRADTGDLLTRFAADVTHWALWMSLGHVAVEAAGRERFRDDLLGRPGDVERRRAAEPALWRLLDGRHALSIRAWGVLADLAERAPTAPPVPITSLTEVLFS